MKTRLVQKPKVRRLNAYAFDPSLSLDIDTVKINKLTYALIWEDLKPGPIGDYIEVIDYDPTIKKFMTPIDLDHPHLLANNGFEPSESNPMYHQQMVYAVTMLTIQNFERALGRKILWSPRLLDDSEDKYEEYVHRLRIYPHAFRDANAYYSPYKKALLFGYFSSRPSNRASHMPDSLVFTCLSHDIIAHEVTHALLDGMHRHFNNPTNPDVLAFHEAFSDIVALFQHFTFPEVLAHQIAKTRGDLQSQNLLGQLAQELGTAIGGYGSLRDAIGAIDPETKQWKMHSPNTEDYQKFMEPHHRGSILVAAIFEVFLTIYKRRSADLLRIASNGTGVLQEGELHPDLVKRLSKEASKAAKHILMMCIRALDYCPPIDITFGDYLRAIITADLDVVTEDHNDYRLAFIDAFRRRGIYPQNIKTLSIDSLEYDVIDIGLNEEEDTISYQNQDDTAYGASDIDPGTQELLKVISKYIRDYGDKIKYVIDREEIYKKQKSHATGLFYAIKFDASDSSDFSELTGLTFLKNYEKIGINQAGRLDLPSFSIQNLRLVSRVGPDDKILNQVVFSVIQRSGVLVKNGKISGYYQPSDSKEIPDNGMEFYGGCTMIFDIDTLLLKYVISKPLIDIERLKKNPDDLALDEQRVIEQYNFQMGEAGENEFQKYFGMKNDRRGMNEPFSILHKH